MNGPTTNQEFMRVQGRLATACVGESPATCLAALPSIFAGLLAEAAGEHGVVPDSLWQQSLDLFQSQAALWLTAIQKSQSQKVS